MNISIKTLTLFALIIMSSLFLNAQKGTFSITPNIGITSPLLSDGIGIHLGVNPSYAVGSHFSLEGQISYAYTKINSSFISGATGSKNAFNTLAGGRLYFISPEKTVRPYINLLFGGNYNREEKDGIKREPEFQLGFSTGIYVEIKQALLGISFDSPENFIFKVGYIF